MFHVSDIYKFESNPQKGFGRFINSEVSITEEEIKFDLNELDSQSVTSTLRRAQRIAFFARCTELTEV